MGSMGGNTPTPHKFGTIGGNMISEFDPISAQKCEYRNTLVDNFIQAQNAVGAATQQIEMQAPKSMKTFMSPKSVAQKSAQKFSQPPQISSKN
jgi:hypothetical protein